MNIKILQEFNPNLSDATKVREGKKSVWRPQKTSVRVKVILEILQQEHRISRSRKNKGFSLPPTHVKKPISSNTQPHNKQSKANPVHKQHLLTSSQREEIQKYTTFIKLANQWRSETKHMSVMNDITSHITYKEIIAMGNDVVPMILRELRREPAHWFWALKSITGDNPIKPEDRGRLNKMTEAWLDWGRRNGCRC